MSELSGLLAKAVSAKGTGYLTFRQMLTVLEDGHSIGLTLFSVDVVMPGASLPLPEWMFRLTDEELAGGTNAVLTALDFYREHASDAELSAAWFEVYFEEPERDR